MDPISVTNSLHFFPHSGPDVGNTGPGNMGGGVLDGAKCRACAFTFMSCIKYVIKKKVYIYVGTTYYWWSGPLGAPMSPNAYIRPCPHCRRVSKASGMKMLGICHDTLWDLKIFRFSASSATDP